MLEIAYYDNITGKQNPPEIMYPFVRELLAWVWSNDAHLTIKTKWRKAFRPFKHGTHINWWRLIKEKNVYEDYPRDILNSMERLKKLDKLKMVKGIATARSGLEPGLEADVTIVIPMGEVALYLCDKRKVYFFNHPECSWKNIEQFGSKEEMVGILDTVNRGKNKELGGKPIKET